MIEDPKRRMVTGNSSEEELIYVAYSYYATIKVNIYDDLLSKFFAIAESSEYLAKKGMCSIAYAFQCLS